MKNFKNCLMGIEIKEPCFEYLQSELKENYSFGLVIDLFSLPCMQYETRNKLSIIFALLEDRETNDTIISWLTYILTNLSGELWHEYQERLKSCIEAQFSLFSRSQLLLLAHTIEIMYAKGYENTFELSRILYQCIPLCNNEFNPDSDDNIRIKLAKIAYSTSQYNFNEKLAAIKDIKDHLKNSGRKYLQGMLNYYKGICLGAAACRLDYKDDVYYIMKSKIKEFELAYVYLDYRGKNFETSKES